MVNSRDGASRIIDRIRSIPRLNPAYVEDNQPWDDIRGAMKEAADGLYVEWERVIGAIVPSIGEVNIDPMPGGLFPGKCALHANVTINWDASPQDLTAILQMLNAKVIHMFEIEQMKHFTGDKS